MRTLIARLIVSAIVTIPVFGSTMLMLYPMPNWVQFVLMLPVMCYAALPIFRSGFAAIIHRSPEMNALVSLGTVCAFAYSCVVTFIPQILPENAREPYFEAVGVVITLMLVGQLLEARARVGTGEAMRALAGLQPKTLAWYEVKLKRKFRSSRWRSEILLRFAPANNFLLTVWLLLVRRLLTNP